jgi:hypothetical protein
MVSTCSKACAVLLAAVGAGCQTVQKSPRHPIPVADYLSDATSPATERLLIRPFGVRLPVSSSETLVVDLLLTGPTSDAQTWATILVSIAREDSSWIEIARPDGQPLQFSSRKPGPHPYAYFARAYSMGLDSDRSHVLSQPCFKTSVFTQHQSGRYRVRLRPNETLATLESITGVSYELDTHWYEFELVRADIQPKPILPWWAEASP